MGGYHITVNRLDVAETTRASSDGNAVAARVRSGEIALGERVYQKGFDWAPWLNASTNKVPVLEAAGYPNRYLIRARECPHTTGLPPDEWIHVEMWDES